MPAAAHRCAALPPGYAPRKPEQTLLHQTLSVHWPAFRRRAEAHGGLPDFVVSEVEDFLQCGLFEHGCVVARCGGCGHEQVVGLSCKRRGFYPSCCGRRMADTAAHLVDAVLPRVPIRQWVCGFPWQLRYRGSSRPGSCPGFVRCRSKRSRCADLGVHGRPAHAISRSTGVRSLVG